MVLERAPSCIAFAKLVVCSCAKLVVEGVNVVFNPNERPRLSVPLVYIKDQIKYCDSCVNSDVLSVMNRPKQARVFDSTCPYIYTVILTHFDLFELSGAFLLVSCNHKILGHSALPVN